MPLTVRFVRHGESQANVDRVFANRVEQPFMLTPDGIEQAHRLADTLAGMSVTHIYTSPLHRARQTADILAERFGHQPSVRDALREYDVGTFEGLGYGGRGAWRWSEYKRIDAAWRQGDRHARLAGGESLAEIEARFLPFMEEVATRHGGGDSLVVVSHGGLYRLMLPLVLPELTQEYVRGRDSGHCDVILAIHERTDWRCLQWGDEPLDTRS